MSNQDMHTFELITNNLDNTMKKLEHLKKNYLKSPIRENSILQTTSRLIPN